MSKYFNFITLCVFSWLKIFLSNHLGHDSNLEFNIFYCLISTAFLIWVWSNHSFEVSWFFWNQYRSEVIAVSLLIEIYIVWSRCMALLRRWLIKSNHPQIWKLYHLSGPILILKIIQFKISLQKTFIKFWFWKNMGFTKNLFYFKVHTKLPPPSPPWHFGTPLN